MLQSIRDRTHGWIAGVIISLVILSFALWGIHSYLEGSADTSVIAKVNGTEITNAQLAASYERLRRQEQMNAGTAGLSEQVEAKLKQQALQSLINIQVLMQASIAENYRVSFPQIENFLESMPEFQVDGRFSLMRFNQVLSATLFSAGDFLSLIRTTLLIDQPRLGVLLSSFALPSEISNTIALVNQERDIQFMSLPRGFFLNQSINVSDAEISNYYHQHQDEFKTPAQISVDYIELSVQDLMASLKPTTDTLKNYYNENINSYTQPVQWKLDIITVPLAENAADQDVTAAINKANALRQKMMSGTALASSSDFTETKAKDWVTLNQLSSELQKPVSMLNKQSSVSEPIRTKQGVLLLKVADYKDADVQPFEKVVDKVKESLTRQQAEEKFAELREKLANLTYEYPDSLTAAAKALNLSVKTTPLFTKDKGVKDDLTSTKKVRDIAFSDEVLNSQNNSDPIQVNPDTTVVLRVKSRIPAATLSLNSVEKQIIAQLKNKKADEQALQTASEIKKKLESGMSLEQVVNQYHFTWNNVGFIGRYSTKVDPAILYTAFRMPKLEKNKNTSAFTVVKVPEGYAVIALKSVRDGKVSSQEQYDVFADQIQTSEGLLEYNLYQQGLIHRAKIKMVSTSQSQEV